MITASVLIKLLPSWQIYRTRVCVANSDINNPTDVVMRKVGQETVQVKSLKHSTSSTEGERTNHKLTLQTGSSKAGRKHQHEAMARSAEVEMRNFGGSYNPDTGGTGLLKR